MSTELQDNLLNLLIDIERQDKLAGLGIRDGMGLGDAIDRMKEIVSGPLPVWIYADLSTCHITKDDSYKFSSCAQDTKGQTPCVVYEYEEGFWVYVPSKQEDLDDYIKNMLAFGFSTAATSLVRLANRQRLAFIRLDSDGTIVSDLEHYETENCGSDPRPCGTCPECSATCYKTPSGIVCENGHGGVLPT